VQARLCTTYDPRKGFNELEGEAPAEPHLRNAKRGNRNAEEMEGEPFDSLGSTRRARSPRGARSWRALLIYGDKAADASQFDGIDTWIALIPVFSSAAVV